MTVTTVLPKNLTVADWTAKKKLPTKISGNTGIGAALTRLKLEWDKVDWEALDPNTAVSRINASGEMTHAALEQARPAVRPNLVKVPAAHKQLKVVLGLIKTTETKWRANKLIPSASIKHMAAMKAAAAKIDTDLDGLADDLDQAWVVARQMADLRDGQKANSTVTLLKSHTAKVRAKAPKILQADDPVKDYGFSYTKPGGASLHQLITELNTALQRTTEPQWATARQTFAALARKSYLPATEAEVDAKIRQVLRALDALEQTL